MPTYEYRCKACSHTFEAVQSFSDEPLTECPQCGGQVRKLFGNVGITFKGSGFYRTDSRASSSPASTGERSSESSSSERTSTGSSSPNGSSSSSEGSSSTTAAASSSD